MQIEALANEIASTINNEKGKIKKDLDEKREAFIESKINRNITLKEMMEYKDHTMTQGVKAYIGKKHYEEIQKFSVHSIGYAGTENIKRDIILATIEDDNIESIKAAIIKKYS